MCSRELGKRDFERGKGTFEPALEVDDTTIQERKGASDHQHDWLCRFLGRGKESLGDILCCCVRRHRKCQLGVEYDHCDAVTTY